MNFIRIYFVKEKLLKNYQRELLMIFTRTCGEESIINLLKLPNANLILLNIYQA